MSACEHVAGGTLDLEERSAARGDVRRTLADTSRARSELGWAPEVGLADGLRAQWDWTAGRVSLARGGRRGARAP